MSIERARDEKFAALIDGYDLEDEGQVQLIGGQRYALIESSNYGPRTAWITRFNTAEEAAAYHDTQEYPEDWLIEDLIDLDTGRQFYPISGTTFEERPTVLEFDNEGEHA